MLDDTSTILTPPATIKVALVEDRREIREGLAMLINGTDGFHCVGSYNSMEEALRQIGHQLPDVVLSDIGLPGMSGIEGVRILKERYPQMLLLMLTIHDDDELAGPGGLRHRRMAHLEHVRDFRVVLATDDLETGHARFPDRAAAARNVEPCGVHRSAIASDATPAPRVRDSARANNLDLNQRVRCTSFGKAAALNDRQLGATSNPNRMTMNAPDRGVLGSMPRRRD